MIEHFSYVWAAYSKGAFDEGQTDLFPKGMNGSEFKAALVDVAETFLRNPMSEMLAVLARTPEDGIVPIALVTLEYSGRLAFPHCYWFPWAGPRNRLEAAIRFFIQLKKNHLVLITCRHDRDMKFFQHLCKYGLLRAVGKIRDYYEDGSPTMMFQSVGS